MISTPEGTFPISAIGAATCRITFAAITSTAGIIGAATGTILLASTSPAGGGKIDEIHNLDDGTVVRLQGNGSDLKRTATRSMPDGTNSVLDFMLDPTTGALVLTGGTLNGKPMARPSLQTVVYSMQSGGAKNVVLSQNAGIGHNGGPPMNNNRSNNGGNSGGKPPLVSPPVTGMNIDYDKISTAKPWQTVSPRNLEEQVLWNQVIANPAAGNPLNLTNDLRFPAVNGWQKMEATHRTPDGRNISIHYQYNSITGRAYDMKLTNLK